jgi:hypothetical protein
VSWGFGDGSAPWSLANTLWVSSVPTNPQMVARSSACQEALGLEALALCKPVLSRKLVSFGKVEIGPEVGGFACEVGGAIWQGHGTRSPC